MDLRDIKQKLRPQSPVWAITLCLIVLKSYFLLSQMYALDTLRFDFYNLAPAIFLLSFALLLRERAQYLYLFIANVLISTLYFVDLSYDRAFGHLLNIYMIFGAGSVASNLDKSATVLLHGTDFLLFLDLPVWIFLFLRHRHVIGKRTAALGKKILLFVLAGGCSFAAIHSQAKAFQDAYYCSDVKKGPLYMSPLGDFMYSVGIYCKEKAFTLDEADKEQIQKWYAANEKYQQADAKYAALSGMLKGKNIIAIHFESLENFVIGKSFYDQEITPNLNAMLKNSIYFSSIHEQVRDGNSSDCELMFNTSLYPLSTGSAFIRFGTNDYLSLAKLLEQQQGYQAAAIHGDSKEFWNRYIVYPKLGYSAFIDRTQFDDQSSMGLGITDKSLFTQMVKEIKTLKSPYLLSSITLSTHVPFVIDEADKTLTVPEVNDATNYLQSIHYADACVGQFLRDMQAQGMLQNTAIVIYGDHEGVHKYCQTDLPDNNKEIPYIIYVPGMQGVQIDKIGGQIDMLPTLSYLLGLDKATYADHFMGRNLFGSYAGTAILADGTILGDADDQAHLEQAQQVADKVVMGFDQYYDTED